MTARSTALVGLFCLAATVGLMYLPFGFLYPGAATLSEAYFLGTAPSEQRSFFAPTELPSGWARSFLPAAAFALGAGWCTVRLDRRAAASQPSRPH